MTSRKFQRGGIVRGSIPAFPDNGYVFNRHQAANLEMEDGTYEVCGLCRGTGNIGSHLCPDCWGRCIVPHECSA